MNPCKTGTPNLMTPLRGRGFGMQSTKKSWTKPEVRQFETLEQLLETYGKELPDADFRKLAELVEQLQRTTRRHTPSAPLRKSAQG